MTSNNQLETNILCGKEKQSQKQEVDCHNVAIYREQTHISK